MMPLALGVVFALDDLEPVPACVDGVVGRIDIPKTLQMWRPACSETRAHMTVPVKVSRMLRF